MALNRNSSIGRDFASPKLDKAEDLIDPLSKALNLALSEAQKKEIHDAREEFTEAIEKKNPNQKENFWSNLKKQEWIHAVHKNLFDDDCFARKILSLENELAEGLDPSFEQLKAPKWLRNGLYRALWAMTFVTTGFRAFYEAVNEEKGIAGVKKVVQDGVSVVALTTIAARALNKIQEKIYTAVKLPLLLKNSLRPLLTIFGCVKGIHYFDMVGKPAGDYAVKFIEGLMSKNQTSNSPSKELLPSFTQ